MFVCFDFGKLLLLFMLFVLEEFGVFVDFGVWLLVSMFVEVEVLFVYV